MGRIRTVKPELFTHEELFAAEKETGLPIRLAYIGLFTVCDREGRFKWEPNRLKLAVLPYDTCDFERVLDALLTRGFVVKYAHAARLYGVIPTFGTHQVINNRESASILPEPNENNILDVILTRDPRVIDASPTPLSLAQGEGKGREGKGKEGEKEGEGVASAPGADAPSASSIDAKAALEKIAAGTAAQPGKKKGGRRAADEDLECFNGIDSQLVADFKVIRKAKDLPITKTAMDGFMREAEKAGKTLAQVLQICCEKGWGGFSASWLNKDGSERRQQPREADGKMSVNGADHSSTHAAMQASMKKHGIVMPAADDPIDF